jgi:hypothetical protein
MDHEIMTHTKKAYKLSKDKSLSFWKKISEIAIEIGIIVFAVTFSIWLHDRSEHKHEQAQVKQFLAGLKTDLQDDIKEMRGDSASYRRYEKAFRFFSSAGTPLNHDSVSIYSPYLFNTTGLIPNNGRYEGFKASGKLINIEDAGLQNNIADFYQEIIPSLLISTTSYTSRKEMLYAYYLENVHNDARGNNIEQMLVSDKARNIFSSLSFVNEAVDRYSLAIQKAEQIINGIDEYR